MSGILILGLRPFQIGDEIVVGETEGSVQRIRLRTTEIKTYDGRLLLVPNAELFTSRVTNNTAAPVRRTSVEVPVAYGTDLARAERALRSAAEGVSEVLAAPVPSVRVRLLGTPTWSSSFASGPIPGAPTCWRRRPWCVVAWSKRSAMRDCLCRNLTSVASSCDLRRPHEHAGASRDDGCRTSHLRNDGVLRTVERVIRKAPATRDRGRAALSHRHRVGTPICLAATQRPDYHEPLCLISLRRAAGLANPGSSS